MSATIYQSTKTIGVYTMIKNIKVLYGQDPKKFSFVLWDLTTKENIEKDQGIVI